VSDIYVFDMEYFGQWYMFQYKNSQIIGIIQITQKFFVGNLNFPAKFGRHQWSRPIFLIFEAVIVGLFRLVNGGRLGLKHFVKLFSFFFFNLKNFF